METNRLSKTLAAALNAQMTNEAHSANKGSQSVTAWDEFKENHCCPRQDRVVMSAVESEALGIRKSGWSDQGLCFAPVVPVQVMSAPG